MQKVSREELGIELELGIIIGAIVPLRFPKISQPVPDMTGMHQSLHNLHSSPFGVELHPVSPLSAEGRAREERGSRLAGCISCVGEYSLSMAHR
jgi:hypothetical protein